MLRSTLFTVVLFVASSLIIYLVIGVTSGDLLFWYSPHQEMYRILHLNGSLYIECPMDRQGNLHGEMKTYDDEGNLISIIDIHHGLLGRSITRF